MATLKRSRPVPLRSGKLLTSAAIGELAPGTVVVVEEIAYLADGAETVRVAPLTHDGAAHQGVHPHPAGWLTRMRPAAAALLARGAVAHVRAPEGGGNVIVIGCGPGDGASASA